MFYRTMIPPRLARWLGRPQAAPTLIPDPSADGLHLTCSDLPDFVRCSSVAMKYRALWQGIAWKRFPERDASLPWPGVKPEPRLPYALAFLVKVDQGLPSLGHLRSFLVAHPALVWLLGFPVKPAAEFPWGFDVERSLPSSRHFSNVLRTLPNASLQFLLDETVRLLREQAPDPERFGDQVSLDTKHILAWVRENNPKEFVRDRFDKTRQPGGDPDCRLGCKRRHNRGTDGDEATGSSAPATPAKEGIPASRTEVGEFYWGYGSGIVVAKVPGLGEIVLAELTQPFNEGETTYFFPLMNQVERRLGRRPRFGTLDAAFDAFYIYDYFHEAGGFAAIPLAKRGKSQLGFDGEGRPLCEAGLAMWPKHQFWNHRGLVPERQARYACPLLTPDLAGEACPIRHSKWPEGGCVLTLGLSAGVRIRHQLDREGEAYQRLYDQRTASERLFSQAKDLGMERPKLRNQASIANLNTLSYVLLNLRTLLRLKLQSRA